MAEPLAPKPADPHAPWIGHADGPFAGIVAWVKAEFAKLEARIAKLEGNAAPAPKPTPPAPTPPAPAPAASKAS
jgi:hypothetical protein